MNKPSLMYNFHKIICHALIKVNQLILLPEVFYKISRVLPLFLILIQRFMSMLTDPLKWTAGWVNSKSNVSKNHSAIWWFTQQNKTIVKVCCEFCRNFSSPNQRKVERCPKPHQLPSRTPLLKHQKKVSMIPICDLVSNFPQFLSKIKRQENFNYWYCISF